MFKVKYFVIHFVKFIICVHEWTKHKSVMWRDVKGMTRVTVYYTVKIWTVFTFLSAKSNWKTKFDSFLLCDIFYRVSRAAVYSNIMWLNQYLVLYHLCIRVSVEWLHNLLSLAWQSWMIIFSKLFACFSIQLQICALRV